MIGIMKNCTRQIITSVLCLSLSVAQASFAVPAYAGEPAQGAGSKSVGTPILRETTLPGEEAEGMDRAGASKPPVLLNPLAAAISIARQVEEAALRVKEESEQEALRRKEESELQAQQIRQLNELMEAQQNALDRQADSHSADPLLPGLPGETLPEQEDETEAETETEAGIETEARAETESELPEETETEFHPVETGSALPEVGGMMNLPEETETEGEGSGDDADAQTPATEEGTGKTHHSDLVPRHGTFAIPGITGFNEARISLYDYRMLRAYPISRLPKDLHILYRQLKDQIAEYDGTWSVYVQNLNTGQTLILNDASMRSASVMKLFIMGTVYEAFDRGDLPRNEDTVYLLRSMIINSSNESSNRLLSLLGDGDIAAGIAMVNEFIRLRGFTDGTVEFNGFEDPAAAINPDCPNMVTAKDVGLLLSRIYRRTFISRKVCNEIEQMMLDQATRYKIPRGLPDGVECGNKSGETDTIANDAAVIYGPTTDYILVVLSNDWSSENAANEQVEAVSRTVYGFFEQ